MADKINLNNVLPSYLVLLFSIQLSPNSISTIVLLLVVCAITFFVLYVYLRYLSFKKQLAQESVLLEIIPPSISLQSAFSTKQFFSILHSLDHEVSFIEKLLGIKKRISYEIVSSREEGIRYLIYVPNVDVSVIRKDFLAYLPGIEIQEVSDYLPKTQEDLKDNEYSITEFKLKRSFVLSLQEQDVLSHHDPIAYITAHMTKLVPDELISLQIVTTPVTPTFHSGIMDHLYTLNKRIYDGKEIVSYIRDDTLNVVLKITKKVLFFLLDLTISILGTVSKWFLDIMMASSKPSYQQVITHQQPQSQEIRELTPKQKEIQTIVESKINQNLFEVSIRLLVVGSSKEKRATRKNGITGSFSTFTNLGYQSLHAKSPLPFTHKLITKLEFLRLKYRLFSFSANPILSVSELSTIYHFPYTETTQTEDIINIKSKQLPAPLSVKKKRNNLDIVFAHNIHGESITPIGLTLEERRRHMYVIGATGMGKTTLLLQMIHTDMLNGKGLALLDPHGDLTERLLGVIPLERIKDIIYFNPYDLEYPLSLNILELSDKLAGVEIQREKDLIASSLISIFLKLYPSSNARPRMEHILRNTVLLALTVKNPTLQTVYKILIDKTFRTGIVEKLEDPILKAFWSKEFAAYGSFQKADAISPITNKLGEFLTTMISRNILTQKKNKLNFEDIMNNKKILICDLSKGKIGEDTSSFLGSLIIAKIQLAALKRVHVPPEERSDFFLYIDEFQNFATMTFAQILSEARKYRLNTILAHQTISQIEDKDLLKVILANVGTVIAYRTSNPSDEDFILPLFKPQVKENEIPNLPSYNFYIKINALNPQDAFTGTMENFSVKDNSEIRERVIKSSQKMYGLKPPKIEPESDTPHVPTETEMDVPQKSFI